MVNKDKLVIKATLASITTASVIIIIKIVALLFTGSTAILASLTDSLIDIISSFINLMAVRYALQPPDQEHRFGHGKAEDLAVLIQSVFFIISGLFVIGIAIKKIIIPQPLDNSEIAISLILLSIAITVFLILYQSYVIKQTSSKVIKADRLHYIVDFFTNGSLIVSLVLSTIFDSKLIDPIFAIAIAIYMLYEAFKLLTQGFSNLMDHEVSDIDRNKIKEIIMSHPDVKGLHDLKTRSSGSKSIIQLHLEMDGNVSLYKAHTISDEVESLIRKQFKNTEIIIHQDPEDIVEQREFTSL